jgi:hypothetical protein
MTAATSLSGTGSYLLPRGGPIFGVRKRHHKKVIGYSVQNPGRNPPVGRQLL